jgi:hypothetical protein
MTTVRLVRSHFVRGAGHFNAGESATFADALARTLCAAGIAVVAVPAQPPPEEISPVTTALTRPPADKMLRAPRRKGVRRAQ